MEKIPSQHRSGLFFLALAALGVVYGDIGTSPLYTINEIFFGHGRVTPNATSVLGSISLVLWGLTLVVAFKYVIYVLRADNEGQGGVFALYGLINTKRQRLMKWVTLTLLLAAGLLFGDGVITPAISVLSAVEGLNVATKTFEPYIIPITLIILTFLFAIQYKGTAKVGAVFGPIVVCWFVAIGGLGLHQIILHPGILQAFNPWWGAVFIRQIGFVHTLLVLGSVMLAITGGEALYADLGHFGKKPIRWSWFTLVYPALLLTYLGQGAFLLGGHRVVNGNIFYSVVPHWGIYPMVILATFATIIASQALISGAFSLATQGVALSFFPRFKIQHTHEEHEGQIYVPLVNWALYVGCVILVLIFKSSSALASAYGLAVSGVMLATSLGMIAVATQRWKWSMPKAIALFGILGLVDLSFVVSNSLKFWEGGFIPLGIGVILFIIMTTWRWGREKTYAAFERYPRMTLKELLSFRKKAPIIERPMIIFDPRSITESTDKIPALLEFFWERYQALPRDVVFLTVSTAKTPFIHQNRYEITKFTTPGVAGFVADVTVNFGFMEEQNVEKILHELVRQHELDLDPDESRWMVHLAIEHLIPTERISWVSRLRLGLFRILRQNSQPAHYYYGLGNESRLAMEVMPIKIQ